MEQHQDQHLDQQLDQVVQQQDAAHWKGVYLRARLRTAQLGDQGAFQTSSLIGHSARVYALYYRDGLLCTGGYTLVQYTHICITLEYCFHPCVCFFFFFFSSIRIRRPLC